MSTKAFTALSRSGSVRPLHLKALRIEEAGELGLQPGDIRAQKRMAGRGGFPDGSALATL